MLRIEQAMLSLATATGEVIRCKETQNEVKQRPAIVIEVQPSTRVRWLRALLSMRMRKYPEKHLLLFALLVVVLIVFL